MSFSASANTPSAQATLTSDFRIAMFCSCIMVSLASGACHSLTAD